MKTQTLTARIACPKRTAGRLRTACATRLLPLLLLLALPATAQAQFTYTVNNGAVTITGYTGPGGAVTIPDTIAGLPVTSLGYMAFSPLGFGWRTSLASVTIPGSVTSLGQQVFADCLGLTSVYFLGNAPSYTPDFHGGPFSFYGLAGYITDPATVYYQTGTTGWSTEFYGLFGLPAFLWDPPSDATYTATNGAITITGYAGSDTSWAIPNTINGLPVTSIGSNLSTRLADVTIPTSVTNVAGGAFSGCLGLTAIAVDGQNAFYAGVNGVLFSKSQTTLVEYPCGLGGSYTIPKGVTSIADLAFGGCRSLTSVSIGSGVTSIGDGAFLGCSSLTAITVDALNPAYSSVDGVLFDKSQTVLIEYPGGKAGNYTIPNGATTIETDAFSYCSSLTGVTIAKGVTSIGADAFSSCHSLASVTIGNGVTSIGDYAFYDCPSLTNVYFLGNAPSPSTDLTVFSGDTNATVHFLPGTTGWGGTFDGLPTPLWVPFNYTTNNGTITITGYIGRSDAVTIPDVINGLPVTGIADYAFPGGASLTSATIPSSVTNIGERAFKNCPGLTAITVEALNSSYSSADGVLFDKGRTTLVLYPQSKPGTSYTIPNSVTSIGSAAFSQCSSLASVTIPTSVTNIGESAFEECYGLTGVTIPSAVTSIGESAFADCMRLTSVAIPNNVTSIGGWAFYDCSGLTNATIGNSVTNIGDDAFMGCSLTSVTIPNSVTYIGDSAFEDEGLRAAYFQGNAPQLGGSYVFSGGNVTVYYMAGTTGWGSTFGGRPAVLWSPPVQGCTYSTKDGAITITGYTGPGGDVTIPGAVTGLPVTRIGTNAFYGCHNVASVTIPNSVTNIGDEAFMGCSLTSVTIPDSVTSIGLAAFCDCESLTNVTIPDSVTRLGNAAFQQCTSLRSVTIPNSLTNIGNAFSGCTSLRSLTIPNSVTSIADAAFWWCLGLTHVTIPNSVTSIGDQAFGCCGSLASVTIPASVTRIGTNAFLGCGSLASVTIANGVAAIGNEAFQGCASLAAVTIPESVTSIGVEPFSGCSSLAAITVDALNPSYSSADGVLFDKNQTTLIECPERKAGGYTIPNSVTSIEAGAFDGCGSLTSVTIPNGVSAIGDSAFQGCGSLTSVTIPNSVTNIGAGAFESCTNLANVTIGNGVTSIGGSAFLGCINIIAMYFEGNAPSLGGDAFGGGWIYYLPGTAGWGPTFGSHPTVLWNPQVQTRGASFGLRTNQFGFNITGTSNLVVVVEASTNLAGAAWSPLQTNTLSGSPLYFSDPQWTNYPARFYRLRWP